MECDQTDRATSAVFRRKIKVKKNKYFYVLAFQLYLKQIYIDIM